MGAKKYLIISLLCISLLFSLIPTATAVDVTDIEIHMLGESPRTRFDNPVIVAGIWHKIKVTFDEQIFQTISLRFYNGSSMPSFGNRDETNYYEWKYDSNAQEEWIDLQEYDGYSYINSTNCQITDNTYEFCVGIKDTLPAISRYTENWTLGIYTGGIEVYSTNVVIEKPTTGLSKTHHDTITFRVDPFTETDIVKDDPELDEYFIMGNTGNTPLIIDIDYGAYNQFFDIINSGGRLSSGSSFNHFVTLHSDSWRAGVFTVTGDAIGTIPDDLIITTASITFETSLSMNAADLVVSVGYSDYKIQAIPDTNIVFQYPETLEMYEGQERDIKVYVSGEGATELEIWSDEINVEILSITSRDQTGTPMTITTTNNSEYAVTLTVRALRENKVGEITYELEIDGRYHTYTTEITIDAPQEGENGGVNLPTSSIVIGVIIVIVVGYMFSIQIRHRRR